MPDPISVPIIGFQELALVYAAKEHRRWLALVLAFDCRMADVIRQAKEPLIAQMRFAWWRDTLAKPPELRPKGEPLLLDLAKLDGDQPQEILTSLVDAWELLLSLDGSHDVILRHCRMRSEAIFSGYANCTHIEIDVEEVGRQWALADLIRQSPEHSDMALSQLGKSKPRFARLPRQLRPLAILHFAANLEAYRMVDGGKGQKSSSLRLLIGALTGR